MAKLNKNEAEADDSTDLPSRISEPTWSDRDPKPNVAPTGIEAPVLWYTSAGIAKP